MLFCFTSEFDCRVGHLVLLDTWCCFVLHLSLTVDTWFGHLVLFCFTSEFDCRVGHLVLFCFTSEIDCRFDTWCRCFVLQQVEL